MIRIVNLRSYTPVKGEVLIKVDRTNKILGNSFKMNSEKERDLVCDNYEKWFDTQIKNKNEVVLRELRQIYKVALKQDVALGCWCYPKRCHALTIKRFLDSFMPKKAVDNADSKLIIINSDILNIKSGTIVHQVNNCGKMASGLALQIRNKYPSHYEDYMTVYNKAIKDADNQNKSSKLLGTFVDTKIGELTIRGIFAQDGYGRDKQYTSYEYLEKCLKDIAKTNPEAVYIPYGIGCGLGGGDWNIVSSKILEILPSAIIVKYDKK